ncbi:NACHT, LRR and PYD domains-containing protein 6-like isoform X2 [Alosa pseudoharengus]
MGSGNGTFGVSGHGPSPAPGEFGGSDNSPSPAPGDLGGSDNSPSPAPGDLGGSDNSPSPAPGDLGGSDNSPSPAPGDLGGSGQGPSPAPGVSISSCHGSHVSVPVLSNTSVQGDVNISYSCSGVDSSAPMVTAKPDTDPKSVIQVYKESILPAYRRVQEYNSLLDEHVLLQDRYTQLLMVRKHRRQRERVEEISSRGDALYQVLTTRERKDYQSISVEQFFSRMDTTGDVPRAVVLQGHSGMGKSFTAQKIMHDWVLGTLFAGTFDVAFHLECKELNLCTQEKSLIELLSLESSFQPAMKEVLTKSPQKVLFLVDGFDELRFSLEVPRLSLPSDAFTRAPVEATLSALLQGHILSKSSLLVTSRSTASDRLNTLLKQPRRFTEILGFSEEGVQEYFQRFFKDEKLHSWAYDSIRSNESLFAACFIPIICWIVCTVLREHFEEGREDQMELTTTTSIFVHFVSTLLEHHCRGLSQPVPTLLRSLGQLAERGILEQQVLFEKKQVEEMVSDPESVPFLCKFLLKKRVGKKTMFSFMHLSFQEFFTALSYATADEEECRSRVENLLQREANAEEDRSGIEYFLKREASANNHFHPIIQFLFGLSNTELASTLKESLGLSISPAMHTQLEEWLLPLSSRVSEIHNMDDAVWLNPERSLDIFGCLYEHHDEELMRKAMEAWESFRPQFTTLSKADCWVVRYCFQYCREIRCVHLTNCNITAEKLRMLRPLISRCKELKLQVEDLSDNDVGELVSCLGEGKTLRLLYLSKSTDELEVPPAFVRLVKSKLTDLGVREILASLTKQKCVGSFELEALSVTLSTVELLFDLLQRKTFDINVSFEAARLIDNEDSDLLFLFSIKKNLYPEFTDDVIPCFQVSAECVWNFLDPERQKRLIGFSLRLAPDTEIATINWRRFFDCCAAESLETDDHVGALMSCLSSMPGLEEVWTSVGHLDEHWTTEFLQLFLTSPHLKRISCSLKTADSKYFQDLCVENYKGMLRLTVKNYNRVPLFLEGVSKCRVDLSLTCVILLVLLSPELQHLDWTPFFRRCLALEGLTHCPDTDECVEVLLSFLSRVPDLRGVRLDLFPLTSTWASGVVTLVQSQPTLSTLRLYCGEQGHGTLSEEGLHILQQSQHLLRGILSLTGLRCRVSADQCPNHTEQKHDEERVELTFSGDSVQERDIHIMHELLDYHDHFW